MNERSVAVARAWRLLGALGAAWWLALSMPATGQAPPAGMGSAMGPTEVGVITLTQEQVPFVVTVAGRAVAFEETDVRPRVDGVISEILYQPGRNVAPGDLLFRIEGDTYVADLAAAEATVKSAEAAEAAARNVVDRYARLAGTSVTTETLEAAKVTLAQAEAALSSAKAARDVAQLNLDRTEIASPISGIVGLPGVSVGAVVTANQSTALATVTRTDPIYVDIEESAKRIQQVRDRIAAGTLSPGDQIGLSLRLETGETYAGSGTLVSPGLTVSTTTGTTEMRIQFDNPDRVIMPGQFLRVEVTLGTTEAVLVPQRATARASDGALTAFVVVDGKAVQRTLSEQGAYQNAWIVTEGVAAGDILVVDGLTNLSDGADVSPVPVTISADGVVSDVTPTDTPTE